MRYFLVILKTIFLSVGFNLILLGNSNVFGNHPYPALRDKQKEVVRINEGEGYIEGTFNNYWLHTETRFRAELKNLSFYQRRFYHPPEMPETIRKEQEKTRKIMMAKMKKRGLLSDQVLAQMEAHTKKFEQAKPGMFYQLQGEALTRVTLRQTSDELAVITFYNPYTINATTSGTLSGKQPELEKESEKLSKAIAALTSTQYQIIDRIKHKSEYNVTLFLGFEDPEDKNTIEVNMRRRVAGDVCVGGQNTPPREVGQPSKKPSEREGYFEPAKKTRIPMKQIIQLAMCHGILDNVNQTIKFQTDYEFKVSLGRPDKSAGYRVKGEGVIYLKQRFKDFTASAKQKTKSEKSKASEAMDEPEEKEKSLRDPEKTEDGWLADNEPEQKDDDSIAGGLLDGVWDITKDSWDYWVDAAKDVIGKIGYPATAWHFEGREGRNVDLPSYEEIDGKLGWRPIRYEQAKYHQNGYGKPELKYINIDGREVVYDGDTHEIIKDPRYQGTYNYCNVAKEPERIYEIVLEWSDLASTYTNHVVFDLVPYYIGGNVRGEH